MSENELIYSFDLGSGSIGVCVRKDKDIKLNSYILDPEFASVKEAAALRRQIRTRIAHKKREEWWIKEAEKAGIEVLSTKQPTIKNPNLHPDKRMLIEFLPESSKDKTIYSSHLLRIALLQGVKLEGWQVFKAVWSAIQHRGYDANLPWAASANDADEKENSEAANKYNKKLRDFFCDKEEYHYPCYYEAYIQGIWNPKEPDDFTKRLSSNPDPARNKDKENMAVHSRELVYKELKDLITNAAKLFPKLKGKEEYIIYGPAEEAYASYKNPGYSKYRGTEWDWQGLLGQKVPRFDNRIISKCCLIPRLNVCKADKQLNKEVTFLLALKNMRYAKDNTNSKSLSPEQIKELFEKYKKNISSAENKTKKALINSRKWKKYIQSIGGEINVNQEKVPQRKFDGRSRFCKSALNILHGLILLGKNPHDYYNELIKANKNTDINKGLIKEDYKFLLSMPNSWDGICIPDTREDDKKLTQEESHKKIQNIISGISNRIVRHRLEMLVKLIKELNKKFGTPDKIIFEIVREDFISEKTKVKYKQIQNANKKEIDQAVTMLKDADVKVSSENILRARLFLQQNGKDIYDTSEKNRNLLESKIEQYEIDHIVPISQGGSDSFVNFVLTKRNLNQDKFGLTPYEWFHKKRPQDWESYLKNIENFKKSVKPPKKNRKKIDLLTSDKAAEIEQRKTDLQATSYIEKLSQTIAGLYFQFGINTKGDKKKILFFTGGDTANVRSKLGLNRILFEHLSDDEYKKLKQQRDFKDKNRKNEKHHALDALVLSVLPEITTSKKEIKKIPEWFDVKFCEKHLKDVIPETIKQVTPKLRETIYALRCRLENGKKCYYFVSHFDSSIENFRLLEGKKKNDKSAKKNIDKIFDLKIKKDFQTELSKEDITQEKWEKFFDYYTKAEDNEKEKIKKISIIDSKCFDEAEVYNNDGTIREVIGEYGQKGAMAGQWIKGKEGHQGQIIYKDEKEKWRVAPVYVFESKYKKLKEYKDKYKEIKFFKSGQLIELKRNFEDIKVDIYIKAGIYKLRTILLTGQMTIEDISTQKKYTKNIGDFIKQCDLTSYKKPIRLL